MNEILDIKKPLAEKVSVQVIARAAAILRAIHDEGGSLSLAQIAQRVSLPRSTVQRIVNALEAERLLIAATPNGHVVIGPGILRLASSATSAFVDLVRPRLTRLSADLKETVDLAVIKKDRLIFIDQVVGSQRLRTVSAVGETFPLYCTANGKAYLATLSERAVERLIGRTFAARTPNTITSLNRLLPELAKIRTSGIALDEEEHTLGICAAGIAVADHLGNAHAISVPIPATRFPLAIDQVRGILLELTEELTDLIGALRE